MGGPSWIYCNNACCTRLEVATALFTQSDQEPNHRHLIRKLTRSRPGSRQPRARWGSTSTKYARGLAGIGISPWCSWRMRYWRQSASGCATMICSKRDRLRPERAWRWWHFGNDNATNPTDCARDPTPDLATHDGATSDSSLCALVVKVATSPSSDCSLLALQTSNGFGRITTTVVLRSRIVARPPRVSRGGIGST